MWHNSKPERRQVMMSPDDSPIELRISYSAPFSWSFVLDRAERLASVGYTNWRFNVRCVIGHPTGQFTYEACDSSLAIEAFQVFHSQLCEIGSGQRRSAELADADKMFSFALTLSGYRLQASIRIREYQPENDLTTLNANFWVDYDLFVNKLRDELKEFIERLRLVVPEEV